MRLLPVVCARTPTVLGATRRPAAQPLALGPPLRALATSARAHVQPSRTARAQPGTDVSTADLRASVFAPLDEFAPRHLGPRTSDADKMLASLGYQDFDAFIKDAVPNSLLFSPTEQAEWDAKIQPISETELLARGTELGKQNKVLKSLIGMGYSNTLVPTVILRNVSTECTFRPQVTPADLTTVGPRKPSLVHILHSLPSRDLAGSPRIPAQLPDDGQVSDWSRPGQRLTP